MWRRWIHKSQIWLHMTTWFTYKIGFYKIRKSKTCHFWKIMQITPYSIFSNYKLSMATFDNILQMQPNCMEAPSMCTWHVEYFLCLWIWVIHVMDQFPKWHLGWIVHKIFCIVIITPYDIFQPTHLICFRPQSCGVLFGHLSRGIYSS